MMRHIRRAPMRFYWPLASLTPVRYTPPLPFAARLAGAAAATVEPAIQRQLAPIRWHSTEHGSKAKVYDFDGIKNLLNETDDGTARRVVLIDVREPGEFAAGAIPTAVNMPISSCPDGLFLPPDEFEDRFGFEKPPLRDELVFYCKAGVRSSAAAQLAQRVGYERVGEYRGSWLDWVKRATTGGE